MPLPKKCPLCYSDYYLQDVVTSHVFGNQPGRGNAFFRCKSCDVIYQYPGLSKQEEEKFYSAEFENFMDARSGKSGGWLNSENHVLANEKTRLRRMKYLEKYLDSSKEILEIGCSSGFMLYPLIEEGHNCIGIEPSGIFSQFLERNKVISFESLNDFRKNYKSIKFDLIMHFFVLEHISNPAKFLSDLLELLKPGGRLIFEIPNSADPLFSIYDIPEFERFYWSIAHPWYFNEKSLEFLLKKLNLSFEIIREQRYDLSNHLVWARDGKPGGMGKFTDKFGEKMEEKYKELLIESGFCDTLVGIVKK